MTVLPGVLWIIVGLQLVCVQCVLKCVRCLDCAKCESLVCLAVQRRQTVHASPWGLRLRSASAAAVPGDKRICHLNIRRQLPSKLWAASKDSDRPNGFVAEAWVLEARFPSCLYMSSKILMSA